MKLPNAPERYDRKNEARTRTLIEEADNGNFKKGQDVELARNERFLLHSPNGSRWLLSISDAGAVVITAA